MRILVTGAGGFVGGHLARLLRSRGHEVAALGLGGMDALRGMGLAVYAADILDGEALARGLREAQPDAVIHLAAVSNVPLSWERPGRTVDVNVRGTVGLVEAIHAAAPGARLLSVGSGDEYGLAAKRGIPLTEDAPCRPQNPYAISKHAAGQMALQLGARHGLRVVHARPFNHFGPGQAKGFVVPDFASQIVAIERGEQRAALRVGNLEASRDFTFVEDVAMAYALLAERDVPGGVYNICSGRARSMQEVLDTLLSLSGARVALERDPARMRPSEVPFFVGDPSKLQKATGWQPSHGFLQGMEETLAFFRRVG